MATVKLFIKSEKVDRQGLTLVQLQFQTNGKRVAFSTGEKIKPKSWDAIKRRMKTGIAGAAELNAKLEKLESDLLKVVRSAEVQGINPTPEYVKEVFDRQRSNLSTPTLKERFDQFIRESGRDKAQATVNIYQNTLAQLIEFAEAKRFRLSFDTLNIRFYDLFTTYLQSERTPRLNPNTIGKAVKTLKTFLNWSVKRGYSDNQTFRDEFKVTKREADFEHLTPLELNNLRTFDFSETPYLDRARDVFVFACLTGLRFSDLENLTRTNVLADRLEITVQKTRETLTVPLAPEAQGILDKYVADDLPLPVVSNQKANDYIKTACQLVGIKQPVQLVTYKGANRVVGTKPKYELITTHTARRTFVCNALEAGIRAEVVMSITGHRSLKSFQRYVRITDDTKFKAVQDWALKRQNAGVFKVA